MKRIGVVVLFLIIAFTVSAADFFLFAPQRGETLRLLDQPDHGVVNYVLQPGDTVRVLMRDEDSLLLMTTEGETGWISATEEDFALLFIKIERKRGLEEFEADETVPDTARIPERDGDFPTYSSDKAKLKIVISIKGLTMHVMCPEAEFWRIYPVGLGTKDKKGVSLTPTCEEMGVKTFWTHLDPKNYWYFNPARKKPEYYGGFPFVRLDIVDPKLKSHTYGMHGPITKNSKGEWFLKRGYVSHGCIRMRGEDAKELFKIANKYTGASVRIQEDYEFDKDGKKIDVDYPIWGK